MGELQSKVESQGREITLALAFLALLLSLSAAGFVFSERRARQVHSLAVRGESAAQARMAEAHALATQGESAGQARAAEVHSKFLEGSVTTLSLVNQTLELERAASERAAGAIEDKARIQLTHLERAAKALISRVPADDDHALVTNQTMKSELLSLASKINSFETNRFILPTDMPLKPHCSFIRGMHLHLDQHFDDAFEEWEAVALDDDAPEELRALTWYWIGRERTNLAQFRDADRAFQHALEHADEARRYEIERIRLEIEFFNANEYDAESLIDDLEALAKKAEAGGTEASLRALPRIRATLGNVHHEVAHEHLAAKDPESARAHFHAALEIFESIPEEKWAMFGRAEALWWLGRRAEAETIFAGEGRRFAQDEYLHRTEFRAKVLARSAELLCCARAEKLRGEVDHVYQDVLDVLGRVDERMTVYSELQRRNVTKKVFREDLDRLRSQASEPPKPVLLVASENGEIPPVLSPGAEQDPPAEPAPL